MQQKVTVATKGKTHMLNDERGAAMDDTGIDPQDRDELDEEHGADMPEPGGGGHAGSCPRASRARSPVATAPASTTRSICCPIPCSICG